MSTHPLADPDYEGIWYDYEGGATVGQIGGENGYVLRDEELGDPDDPEAADARITLEQGRVTNPGMLYSVTLYGWMFQVHKREPATTKEHALEVFDRIKTRLTEMAYLLPYEEDGQKRIEEKAAALMEAITSFESEYTSELPMTPMLSE